MSMQQPGSTSSPANPGTIIPALALYEAYASVQPELEAIALDATIPINIDAAPGGAAARRPLSPRGSRGPSGSASRSRRRHLRIITELTMPQQTPAD